MYAARSLGKSWNLSTAYHESHTRSSDNSHIILYRPTAVIWLWEASSLCAKFKIDMVGRMQTIFSTSYFQFDKRFDFLFVYVMNMHNESSVFAFLASWKPVKLSWKVMHFYYQISVITLFADEIAMFTSCLRCRVAQYLWCCLQRRRPRRRKRRKRRRMLTWDSACLIKNWSCEPCHLLFVFFHQLDRLLRPFPYLGTLHQVFKVLWFCALSLPKSL